MCWGLHRDMGTRVCAVQQRCRARSRIYWQTPTCTDVCRTTQGLITNGKNQRCCTVLSVCMMWPCQVAVRECSAWRHVWPVRWSPCSWEFRQPSDARRDMNGRSSMHGEHVWQGGGHARAGLYKGCPLWKGGHEHEGRGCSTRNHSDRHKRDSAAPFGHSSV